ncbi:MAG: hypothetical protein ABW221_21960 [Vicinamibacteria bacterium]
MIPLVALLALTAAAPPPAAALVLRDQYGREGGLSAERGQPAVALVVTARKLRAVRGFEAELRRRCPEPRVLRVADVPRRPPATYEDVARKLRERVPAEVPVLIDLDGAFAGALGLDVSEVAAVVFDGEGRETARATARKADARAAEAAAALRALGGCSERAP